MQDRQMQDRPSTSKNLVEKTSVIVSSAWTS